MNELTYIQNGDYFIPNLTLSKQPQAPLRKYRKSFKKNSTYVIKGRWCI